MKTLFVLLLLQLVAIGLKAQTAVYVCSQTGAFGFCYGYSNVTTCAYNKCIQMGGRSPYNILSHPNKGYGAIAVGRSDSGRQVVGAAAGYTDRESARRRAISECQNLGGQNVYIHTTWLDE